MFTKDKTTIEQLERITQELANIKVDLKIRNVQSFNEKVVKILKPLLEQWIKQQHPTLLSEKEDILFGTFRRLRNKIVSVNFSEHTLDLQKELLAFIKIECQYNIPSETNRSKNLGLDKTQFKKLLTALQKGDESLIKKVYFSHFNKCTAFLIVRSKSTKAEAYDACIDALIEIRKDLINGKIRYGNLESYFTNRAISKIYKQRQKNKLYTLPITEDLDYFEENEKEQELIKTELTQIIGDALNNLCQECRFILRQFYYEERNLKEIGTKMNKSHDAVRKQITRCRKDLKKYFSKDFYQRYASFFDR